MRSWWTDLDRIGGKAMLEAGKGRFLCGNANRRPTIARDHLLEQLVPRLKTQCQ